MKKNKYSVNYRPGLVMMLIFLIYTVMVRCIDLKEIGPENTKVGFAALNGFFHRIVGYSEFWYMVSKVFGILVILTACLFILYGAIQLYTRKYIKKVDSNILSLAVFYIAVVFFYILFELIIINYRPVIRNGEVLEASYPSSHTLLACCIMGSAVIQFRKLFKNLQARHIADTVVVGIAAVTVFARMLSGVHWITDIIGGILLSVAMLLLYNTAFNMIELETKKERMRRMRKKQMQK